MDIETMQLLIDGCNDPKAMLTIARGYLDGTVLRDKVAAEAWLMRAIGTEDPLESPKAMALLASRILGKGEILSDQDYLDIRRQSRTAVGQEREVLVGLLELGSERQKNVSSNETQL